MVPPGFHICDLNSFLLYPQRWFSLPVPLTGLAILVYDYLHTGSSSQPCTLIHSPPPFKKGIFYPAAYRHYTQGHSSALNEIFIHLLLSSLRVPPLVLHFKNSIFPRTRNNLSLLSTTIRIVWGKSISAGFTTNHLYFLLPKFGLFPPLFFQLLLINPSFLNIVYFWCFL